MQLNGSFKLLRAINDSQLYRAPFYQTAILDGQEQKTWIFDCQLDFTQESRSFPSINKSVVIGQGYEHHWADNHLNKNIRFNVVVSLQNRSNQLMLPHT